MGFVKLRFNVRSVQKEIEALPKIARKVTNTLKWEPKKGG